MTTSTGGSSPATVDQSNGRAFAFVNLLVCFELTSGFLQFGLVPLLPRIGERLAVADSELSWVIALQLMAAAVCVPILGRLGDLYGHRRMLRVSLVLVAAGTVLVAFAPTFGILLVGRVLQGPLAALLPLEIALVRVVLPVTLARRAIARLVGALTFGALLGVAVIGVADKALGDVRLTLLIPAVLAAACVPVSFAAIPESRRRAGARMDLVGALLFGAAMIALLAGVSATADGWFTVRVLGLVGVGVGLLVGFVLVELRAVDPLVDLRAMTGRSAGPFYVAAVLFGVFYFGSKAPTSTFLATGPGAAGYGFGLSTLSISLVLLPGALLSVVGSASTAFVAQRAGYRATLVGAFTLVAVAFASFALLHDTLWHMSLTTAVLGFGVGLALGAMPTVIVEAAAHDRAGIATAVYNNTKTVGGAVAGAIVASLMASFTTPGASTPREGGYVIVWSVAGACAMLAALATAFAQRREPAVGRPTSEPSRAGPVLPSLVG